MKIIGSYFSFFVLFIAVLSACKKEDLNTRQEAEPVQEETKEILKNDSPDELTLLNHTIAEEEFMDMFYTVQFAMEMSADSNLLLQKIKPYQAAHPADCWQQVVVDSLEPKIKIYFDSTRCLEDLKYRQGEIDIVYKGAFQEEGSVIEFSYENFVVSGQLMTARHKIVNIGMPNDSTMNFRHEIIGGVFVNREGSRFEWDADMTVSWVHGIDTRGVHPDDAFTCFYDTIIGVNSENRSFGMITFCNNPSFRDYQTNCASLFEYRVPSSGQLHIKVEGYEDHFVNYGHPDTCDKFMQITIGANTYDHGIFQGHK